MSLFNSLLGGKPTTIQPVITTRPQITFQTIIEVIDDVDLDPLAGKGGISKKRLLADRLYALWMTADGRPVDVKAPADVPLFSDTIVLDRPATDNEAAQVAKTKARRNRITAVAAQQYQAETLPEPLTLKAAE